MVNISKPAYNLTNSIHYARTSIRCIEAPGCETATDSNGKLPPSEITMKKSLISDLLSTHSLKKSSSGEILAR